MLEYLYLTLIAPLEAGMRLALDFGHAQTGSWGLGLIFMSLAVNIVLLPLYHLAETWQEAERRVQHRMEAKLTEIRAVYRGQERYALMRTLYRQHGYHPIFAVRTSFGFLIQVPFFFAAYHFLSSYGPLRGVPFGPLADLAEPDGLLVMGGFAVNLLPFVMTAVNLVSALVYTRRLTRRDKIQLYGIAALFLVLLYDAAAGLVFYWTCNNVFSLFKNIVYEKFRLLDHGMETAARGKKAAKASAPEEAARMPLRMPGAPERSMFMGWPAWILPVLILAAALLMLDCDGRIRYGENERLFLQYLTRFGLVLLCVAASARLPGLRKKNGGRPLRLITLTLAALIFQFVLLWHWLSTGCASSLLARQLAVAALLVVLGSCGSAWAAKVPQLPDPTKGLALSALCWILALVCWYVPSTMFASDPMFFNGEFASSAAGLTWICVLTLLPAALISRSLGTGARFVLSLLLAWLALSAAAYTFVFTRDYGVINGFQLQFEDRLYDPSDVRFDYAVLAGTALVVLLAAWRRLLPALRGLFQAGAVATLGFSLFTLGTASVPQMEHNTGETELPAYNGELFGLSRNGTNVVVIMMDMFSGDHLGRMVREHPELREQLDGFVWYPDTLAVGNGTSFSLPAMVSGEELAPDRNDADESGSEALIERIHKSYAAFFDSLAARGFAVSIVDHNWLKPDMLRKYVQSSVLALNKLSPAYRNRWEQEHGVSARGAGLPGLFPAAVGMFNIAPWSLRKHIYRKGKWMHTVYVLDMAVDSYAMLDGLPQWAGTTPEGNVYKFLLNELTHNPWRMDAETCMPTSDDPYPATPGSTQKVDGIIPEHYISEVCGIRALTRWFDWMKAEGVYDNTQIIIASDHDEHDSASLGKVFDGEYPGRAHALLLVKNRNSRGAMLENSSPMTSADLRLLIEKELAGADWTGPEPWTDPQRVRRHAVGAWQKGPDSDTGYHVNELYKVTGTMFKRENWERVK